MKFQFDHHLDYQLEAIQSVIDVFEGQPLAEGDFELTIKGKKGTGLFSSLVQTEKGIGNQLVVKDEVIYENVAAIQKKQHIISEFPPDFKGRNFSIEMETGTGKTYVYLRTAFELNAKYGFKKFIIVVPSVAIREGVLKSIEIMKTDFQELYNNVRFKHFVFNSDRLSELRSFAIGNELQFMVINIQTFDKKGTNVVYRENDRMSGYAPIEFIQATNPFVIIDEPQTVEGKNATKRKEAIKALNPLCTLRYSATHRDRYNLLYSLDPVQAYQQRLVKRISVASTVADDDPNMAYVKLDSVTNKAGRISCKLSFHKQSKDGAKKTKATIKKDDDLFIKSNEREIYRNNFIVTEINTRPGMEYVKFANNIRLGLGEENGGVRTEVVKEQIKATIKAHFDKEFQLKGQGIKVLSLFFLDKVENYRVYNENGYDLGQYAQWFEEIYNEEAQNYQNLFSDKIIPVEKVHNGYFSKDKKGKIKNTSGSSQDDADTYNLIMRDKETLLSLDNPLKFIFSHSALREGWDNPNVFQICTLNETNSSMKKRQEIGRGLRLPVNQNGIRVKDDSINTLVVVANESYEDFARGLQKEFEEDCGVIFGRLPHYAFVGIKYIDKEDTEKTLTSEESEKIWKHFKEQSYIADDGMILDIFDKAVDDLTFNLPTGITVPPRIIVEAVEPFKLDNLVKKHKEPKKVKLNEKVLLDPEFEKFWNTINTKTIYRVKFDTSELVEHAGTAIKKMDAMKAPRIRTNLADLEITSSGVKSQLVMQGETTYVPQANVVPDILTYIQNKTELTRSTIFEILKESKRLEDFPINPQQFMDKVVKELRTVMSRLIIKGIVYERLEGVQYEMSRFRDNEDKLFFAEERIVPTDKSVYDYVLWDSKVEKRFAIDLHNNKQVKFFIKLPSWFTIETPVGRYNPDWAILKENGNIVYMIRETKSTKDQLKLRISESDKIECGRAHFESIGVDYDVATGIEDYQ